MRKRPTTRGRLVASFLVAASVLCLPLRPARADQEEQIADATDRGIEFLLKAIDAKQAETGEHDDKRMGKIALETYALVVAGVAVDNPTVLKNFENLSKMGLDQTYNVACYLFALDAAISQLQSDASMASPSTRLRDDPAIGGAFRSRLEAGVAALLRMRQSKPSDGGWNYSAGGNRFDNSNTQFAVLGLGVGAKRKVPIPKEVWTAIAEHFIKGQKKDGPEVKERLEYYPEDEKSDGKRDRVVLVDNTKDSEKKKKKDEKADEKKTGKGGTVVMPLKPTPEFGAEALQYFARGWDYTNSGGESWNMTCGGLSSLILAEENLRGQMAPDFQNQLNKSIRDGYGWLMQNWNPSAGGGWKYYGIYSLEKVADLGEVKKFAGHDWFQEASQIILGEQQANGSWPGTNAVQVRWNTAFAILVLNRATSLLTGIRSGRMATTGPFAGRKGSAGDERNWVYIPDYEREFHIPTILRQSRLRPTPKLLKILELALKNYPDDQAGYLVWNLAQTRDSQRSKGVKDMMEAQLLRITGVKYETQQYETWYRRYVEVCDIGKQMKDPEGKLLTFYKHTTKSLPLRKKIIWALGRCRDPGAAELLMDDLANPEQEIRQLAYETLSLLRLSAEPIPAFDAKASASTRDSQVNEVKAWFARKTTK